MSRILHDGLQQMLASARMQVDTLSNKLNQPHLKQSADLIAVQYGQTCRFAISAFITGFIKNPLIPVPFALSGLIRSLNPMQRIIGKTGLTAISASASRSPVKSGLFISVITRSKAFGLDRKAINASTLLIRKETWRQEYLECGPVFQLTVDGDMSAVEHHRKGPI